MSATTPQEVGAAASTAVETTMATLGSIASWYLHDAPPLLRPGTVCLAVGAASAIPLSVAVLHALGAVR